ncbi:MAG TPA: PadR family transcriptional regulator [Thermoanaerobaculia bacterium]|nr:PadR family transcriptional regulator [Thermoanaerobaculia bacterium]
MPQTGSMSLLKGTLDVLILKTLSWGTLHGYAISRFIRESTGDVLTVEEGALYPALRRLENRGWLASSWGLTDTRREAKFYQLTVSGKAQLERELGDWQRYVEAMSRVLFEARPTR